MRFKLLRRFSHLIHRRTRSDSALAFLDSLAPPQATDALPWCHSFNDTLQKAGDYSRYPTLAIPVSQTSPLNSAITSHSNVVPVTTSCVDKCTAECHMGNGQLNDLMKQLIRSYDVQEQEFCSLKNTVASEERFISETEVAIKTAQDTLNQLDADIQRYNASLHLLLDVDLCGPVFRYTWDAIASGSTFIEAAVNAIREAATNPSSPWARLIPAIVGPRSSDQYKSALDATLKARAELRQSNNVAQFWKNTARQNVIHACTVTPSSSTLSEIQETLSSDRRKAVDNLLRKLRSGEIPIRSTVVSQATRDISGDIPSLHIPPTPDVSPKPASPMVSFHSSGSLKDAFGIQQCSLTRPPSKSSRTINPQPTALPHLRDGTVRHVSIGSLYEPCDLTSADHKSHSTSANSVNASLPSSSSFSSGTTPANSSMGSMGSESLSLPPCPDFQATDFWTGTSCNEHRFSFSPEDAVESLERIYTRFTHMRLDTIVEENQPADVTMVEQSDSGSDLVSVPGTPSSVGDYNDITLVQQSSPPKPAPSKRVSMLPFLSKIPRRISLSLSPKKRSPKKTTPTSPVRTLTKPTISSSLKQSPPKKVSPSHITNNGSAIPVVSPSRMPVKNRAPETSNAPFTGAFKQNTIMVRGMGKNR